MKINSTKYEIRDIPTTIDLVEEAKKLPNGHVYEIDWEYPEGVAIPYNSIKGAWKVDKNGLLTGEYWVNEDYRPVQVSDREPPDIKVKVEISGIRDIWFKETDPIYMKKYKFPRPKFTHIGAWHINKDNKLTNLFRPNPYYIPPNKDNEKY